MQVSNQIQGPSPVFGSIPVGKPTGETLQLSLRDAIDRGLRQNLALFLNEQGTRAARAEQLRNLSDLLPNVSARTVETVQQINLAAFGLPTNLFSGLWAVQHLRRPRRVLATALRLEGDSEHPFRRGRRQSGSALLQRRSRIGSPGRDESLPAGCGRRIALGVSPCASRNGTSDLSTSCGPRAHRRGSPN